MMKFHEGNNAAASRQETWHARVFPHGRMCSLRGALLIWLVPLLLTVGIVTAVFSYFSYGRMVNQFMDEQMAVLGSSVSVDQGRLMVPSVTDERMKWGSYAVQMWDRDGRLLASSWPAATAPLQPAGLSDITMNGREWRAYATDGAATGGLRVQVLQSGDFRRTLAAKHALSALLPVLIILPLAMLVLWGIARAVSLAVRDIGRQAESQDFNTIAELPLDRVPLEIRPLVVSFNGLLTRLRDAFDAKRRFTQDAAHELRTPLTALSLQLENLRCDLPEGACQQSFAQLESGVQRASRLVDQMLKMSRQEGAAPEPRISVDLHGQVRESIAALLPLADQRHIDLGLADDGSAPMVSWNCPAGDLRSALDNLLENALRYTPEGGVVDVRVTSDAGKPVIEIVDSGPGIPDELISRVFDRFFRVPGTAARGSGLGLAIARTAAERCGLKVVLRNRRERSGLVARLEAA